MRKKIVLVALGVIAIIIGLCACSRTEELLATVPASSNGVMCINAENLLKAAGIEVHDTVVSLPPAFKINHSLRTRIQEVLPRLRESVDISDIVIAMPDTKNAFATFLLKDRKILAETLESIGASKLGDIDNCEAYSIADDLFVYIGDGQGWAIFGSRDYTPRNIATAAKKSNFKKENPAIASLLGENKMISVAANGRAINFANDTWVVADLSAESRNLTLTVRRTDSDGSVIDNTALTNLDSRVLALIPDNAPVYFAAGLTDDVDWKSIAVIGTLVGGFQIGGMLEAVIPYISKTQGTIAFAASPVGDDAWINPSVSDWDFLFAARMSTRDAAEAVQAARKYLGGMLPVADEPNGFRAGMGEMIFKVSSSQGIFSIVKGEMPAGSGLDKFCSDRMVISASLPESVILRNSGVALESVTGKSETVTTVSLPGCNLPILQAVLEEIFR